QTDRSNRHARYHIPQFAIQQAAVGLFVALFAISAPGAPLFKEEIYIRCQTLVANAARPGFFHQAGAGPGFTTNNDPVNALRGSWPISSSSGSMDKKRVLALIATKSGIRGLPYFLSSTDT